MTVNPKRGRLTGAIDTATGSSFGTLVYLYDFNGNRQSETRNAATMPYVYNPSGSNWLYQKGSDTRYKTANGNTASISGVATFTYDGFNRLATSTTAAEVTTYTYNALGERMKKRNQNGLQTVFHYGPRGELLYERDQAGNTKEYVWLNGRPLARIDNGTAIYYYHVDHLGTPQAMTDETGAVKWRADYEPFGKATVKVAKVENNLRLPGQYFDRETGLHYNYFRDYEPGTGRYVEADPIGLVGGINPYVYADNDPLNQIDPLGLWGGPPAKGTYYPKGPMPKPPKPGLNDPGSWDGAVDATNGLLCAAAGIIGSAAMANKACMPPDAYTCLEWKCTPKCGEPYYLQPNSGIPSVVDPDTPCKCIAPGINPKGKGGLPGLTP